MLSFRIFCLMLLFPLVSVAQENYSISPKLANEKIIIDGSLEEEVWAQALPAKDFFQQFPYDTSYSRTRTEVRLAYDENNLYLAAICWDDIVGPYVISSMRRDFLGTTDKFEIYIDPFGDGVNGFLFGVNPLGVEREGLISNGSSIDWGWDNVWFSKTQTAADKWTIEMAIPFKTLRYKKGSQIWKVNFARVDNKQNERTTWKPVPRNFNLADLAFTGEMRFEQPLPKTGLNATLIPYLLGQVDDSFNDDDAPKSRFNAGGDAKLAITPSLNLDLTINPDFSQVEVDRQVTNLSRFELFFPERRQFFIENSDLFSRFGFTRIRPFFSRRIGIGLDSATGQFIQSPILYGARVSGRLDENWRIGAMNVQTAADPEANIRSTNFTTVAVQRTVFKRSNIAAILVNKDVLQDTAYNFSTRTGQYNRVLGLDYNLFSPDSKWIGKFFYHQLISPTGRWYDKFSQAAYLAYNSIKWSISYNHEYIGTGYAPEVGYVQRNGIFRFEPYLTHYIYPKKNKIINRHSLTLYYNLYTQQDLSRSLDGNVEFGYGLTLQNTIRLNGGVIREFIFLYQGFDPTNSGGTPLPANTLYRYYTGYLSFISNERKPFTYSLNLGGGGYFNGKSIYSTATVNYRIKPIGNIGFDATLTNINLPEGYSDAQILVCSFNADLAFTKNIYFRLIAQYNSQRDNLNLNLRFQWRFRPVSDLFIVYTDNYNGQLGVKNRGIVVKLNYWLNL